MADAPGRSRHGYRGDHSGPSDEADRRGSGVPGEPAPDRSAELEDVTDFGDVGEELRDLALGEPLDEELHEWVAVVGGEGVGTLRGVVVGGAQPDR